MGNSQSSSHNPTNKLFINPGKDTSSLLTTLQRPGEPDVISPCHGTDTIVIPVDTGKESLRAFQWYVEHLHHTGNRVHIIHCCEVEQPSGKHYPDYAIPPEQWEEKLDYCKVVGTRVLMPYEELMKQHSIHGSTCTRIGRPGKTILELASETQASMIVMGSRGLGPIARKLLGSVSEYVVKKSQIPVTVVPPPEKMDLLWYILH